METPKWTHRTQIVYMTAVDEAALSRALREEYFSILFSDGEQIQSTKSQLIDSIHEMTCQNLWITWIPENVTLEEARKRTWYDAVKPKLPVPAINYRRCQWNWSTLDNARIAWDPPTLEEGHFELTFRRDDELQQEFIKNFKRILRKIAVSKGSSGYSHFKPGEADFKGSTGYRAGHDALRWCSEAPRRLLGGKYRHHSKWRFPDDNPYYQGLDVTDRPET